MKPQEFYSELENHDWFYVMSDDHYVYNAGKAEASKIIALTQSNPELRLMYEEYRAYIESGPAFGTERLPKPKCP